MKESPAQFVRGQLMHMGTTRWAVEGMGIGSTDTTLSVTQFSQQHNQLL